MHTCFLLHSEILQRAIALRELAPSPYIFLCRCILFISAETDECPSLRFQDIRKKTKCHGRTNSWTDRRTDNVKTVYPTTNKVCGGGGIIIVTLFQEDNIFSTNASLTYGPQIQRHTCV